MCVHVHEILCISGSSEVVCELTDSVKLSQVWVQFILDLDLNVWKKLFYHILPLLHFQNIAWKKVKTLTRVCFVLVFCCRMSLPTTGWMISLPQRMDLKLWLVASCTAPWTWWLWLEKRWKAATWLPQVSVCVSMTYIYLCLLTHPVPLRWTSC